MVVVPILVAVFALATVPAVRAVESSIDRTALADLYQAMGGAQWTRSSNWLDPNASMCSWHGVVCAPPGGCPTIDGTSVECRVAELNLGFNGLVGPIAAAVEQLANLTKLVLGGNALGGTIPSFGALVKLEWLDLNSAQLTGSIPEFDTLTNLKQLDLSHNQFEGTLPTFVRSTRLERLNVKQCDGLTGTIPSFSTMTQMQSMYLGQNRFVGSIPDFDALIHHFLRSLSCSF
jgi:hypothetical protein